jgi:signal transduction histidine kinase
MSKRTTPVIPKGWCPKYDVQHEYGKSVSAIQRLMRQGLLSVERREVEMPGRKPLPIYRRSDLDRLIPGVRLSAAPPRRQRADAIAVAAGRKDQLLEEALAYARAEYEGDLNRLVADSLAEFIARKKAQAFDDAMAAMAADPAIRKECASVAAEFASADMDGLGHD